MKQFLYSKRILLKPDQSIEEIKEFLKTILSMTMDITDVGSDLQQFKIQGTTGSIFDFVRKAQTTAEYSVITETTEKGKEIRLIVSGSCNITSSLVTVYLAFFLFIMAVGLLPGSFETSGEDSNAIDALIFLLIGFYIKLDIDRGLKEASETIENVLNVIETRFAA